MEELSRGLLDTSVLIGRDEDSELDSFLPQEIAISVATLAAPSAGGEGCQGAARSSKCDSRKRRRAQAGFSRGR